MILNLLRVKQLTVQDMMKRSFAEFYLQKDAPENEKKLEELRLQTKHLQEPNCALCSIDLKKYYLTWAEIFQLKKIVKVISNILPVSVLKCCESFMFFFQYSFNSVNSYSINLTVFFLRYFTLLLFSIVRNLFFAVRH